MSQRTHYDNLKVSRNAPPEVIRAAYKSLAQKYHPDRNTQTAGENERIMKIINAAYEVLSDPHKRRQYDEYLDARQKTGIGGLFGKTAAAAGGGRLKAFARRHRKPLAAALLASAAAILFFMLRPDSDRQAYADLTAAHAASAVSDGTSVSAAPNGEPWPQKAGYIRGYPKLLRNGASSVEIDNSHNDFNVFAKLYHNRSDIAVRSVFVPARGSFTITGIEQGAYDVRYQNLATGALSKTAPFNLSEEPATGKATDAAVVLGRPADGRSETANLAPQDF